MSAAAILDGLHRRGVRLRIDGDRRDLVARVPAPLPRISLWQ